MAIKVHVLSRYTSSLVRITSQELDLDHVPYCLCRIIHESKPRCFMYSARRSASILSRNGAKNLEHLNVDNNGCFG